MIRITQHAKAPDSPDFVREALALGSFYENLDEETFEYILRKVYLEEYTKIALALNLWLEDEDLEYVLLHSPWSREKEVELFVLPKDYSSVEDEEVESVLRTSGLRFDSSFVERIKERFSLLSKHDIERHVKHELAVIKDKIGLRDDLDDVVELEEYFAKEKYRYIKKRAELSVHLYKILQKVS